MSCSLDAAVVKENVDATMLRDYQHFNDAATCSLPIGTFRHYRVITRPPGNVPHKEGGMIPLTQESCDREVALLWYYHHMAHLQNPMAGLN